MLISVIISLINYNYSSNYNMHIPSYTKIYYSYIDHPLHTHYVDLILYILICEYILILYILICEYILILYILICEYILILYILICEYIY